MMNQMGQLSKAPMMDPEKNPAVLEALQNQVDGIQQSSQPPA